MAHWLYLKLKDDGGRKWLWLVMLIVFWPLKLVIKIISKSEICNDCEIEGGVSFSDQGNIIFGAKKTGAGTVIGARVTVGMRFIDINRPEIGRNVYIGSDCVVYGAISIGEGATLLSGTVLTKSIPAGVVMQSNPAQLVFRNFDNSELRAPPDVDAHEYVSAKRGS